MPRATINIGDASGKAATGATWRYARGYVPGEANEGLVAQGEGSAARLPDYDDSGWEVCGDLAARISHGFSFRVVSDHGNNSGDGGRASHRRDAGAV